MGSEEVRGILAVDDNCDAADSLAMLLQALGVKKTHVAYDGRSALESVHEHHPSIVLLDVGMPDMDGFEVARRIRENPETRDILLIALTGWSHEEDRRRSKEAGFDYHLVKPVEIDALQELLGLDDSQSTPAGMATNSRFLTKL